MITSDRPTTGNRRTAARKPSRHSWHAQKRYRVANNATSDTCCGHFARVREQCIGENGSALIEENGRFYIPDKLHAAMLMLLETVTVPYARYERWTGYGRDAGEAHLIASVLESCGVEFDRAHEVGELLVETEPFPSRKPLDRFRIESVLSSAGNIWPMYRRAEHLAVQ